MRKQSILIFFIYGPGAKILAFCPPDDTVYSSFNSKTGGAMSAVGETPNGLEFIRISSHIPKNIQEGIADHVRIWSPELISGQVQISNFQLKKKIRTCPKLKFGQVQIQNFPSKISNLDTSRYEIWTSPDFKYSIDKYKSGHVRILFFTKRNWKSGHVRIFIYQLINENLDWLIHES